MTETEFGVTALTIEDCCEICGKVESLREEDVVPCPDLIECYVRDYEIAGLFDQDDALTFHVHLATPFYICRHCRSLTETSSRKDH